MQLRFRFLKYVFTASLAAAGMASAQTPPADPAAQAPAPAATAEAAAPAAEAPKKSATEEIVVTGTRVRRKDLNTPAPVTVLSRDQISASGKVSLGEFLQALPEQGNSGANAQVNNGNDGSIYVSLRSLGSQRTLVLVNGRRFVNGGTAAGAGVDLGSIPSAAIERIEVLKDGASAIYGSDAIAGVVNVILRKRYNGTEVGGYAGTSGAGGGETYDVHGITGTAGDKGSLLFSAAYQEQKTLLAGDRDFSKTTYNYDFGQNCFADPNSGNCVDKSLAGTGNSTTWPQGRFSIPASACKAAVQTPALQSVCSQYAGTQGIVPGVFMQDPTKPNSQNYVPWDGNAYNTNPTNYLITPSRRIQLFSTGDANLGSEARAFFEASYVNRTSSQDLAPMPLVNSTIPTAPVTISKDSIYNPFGINITSWRKRTVEFGERHYAQDLDTFRVVAGLDGSLGEWAGPLAGWAWDVDYNHGRTAGTAIITGALRMPNVANAVGPSMIDPSSGKPICVRVPGDPTTKIGGCVPMNVLSGVGGLDATAKAYASYTGTDFASQQQDIWSVNASGDLIKLASDRPAGLAIGADYRREAGALTPNPINNGESSDTNYTATNGGYNVKEVYGELVIPLVSGLPLIEDLEVQGAARYNDFSTFGTNTTYKLGIRYSPIRDITLRATYGTAFRAPSIGELYGGTLDSYPGVRDPCRAAAPGTTLSARCIANGVPGGASGDRSTQLLEKISPFTGLGPETANTFTMGAVIQPQMVKNLSLTVDYYNVSVTDNISTRGAAFILQQCFTAAVSDPSLCALVIRDNNGLIQQINDPRVNAGSQHTTGIDFAVRYALPTEDFGRFNLIIDGAYLNSWRNTDLAGVVDNGVGNYDLGVLPRLKMNTGLFWTLGPVGVGVSSRYIGAYKECASGVCTQDDTQQHRIPHYTTFDVFASYTLRNWAAGTTALVVGVTNLTDEQPPFIANAFAANSDPSTYDYVGRFIYTRLTHSF